MHGAWLHQIKHTDRSLLVMCLTSIATVCIALATATSALGRTFHVPTEAPTIQAGLDSLQDGDTVAVALGTYAEAPVAPPLHFVLRGDVMPDTGDYPRPILDPTSLPGPDTLHSLLLPTDSHPVLEDLGFRHAHGIQSFASDPVLRRVIGDSVAYFLHDLYPDSAVIVVEDCRFLNGAGLAIFTQRASVRASDCEFAAGQGGGGAFGFDHSRFLRCRFQAEVAPAGFMLVVCGMDIQVEDCVFGPGLFDSSGSSPLSVVSPRDVHVLRNTFTDCLEGNDVLDIVADSAEGVEVADNTFIGCAGNFGVIRPRWMESPPLQNSLGTFSGNQIVMCRSSGSHWTGNALTLTTAIKLYNNHFFHLEHNGRPATYTYCPGTPDSGVCLHDNLFFDTGIAMVNDYGEGEDARWNWWGDSTGPYHQTQNPNGHGDGIVGNVDFTPWYPDTSFLEEVRRIRAPLPERFITEAYPNPFNSTVILTLIPSETAIVRVELFDVLGRRVQELWSGPLAHQKTIRFDGSHLASGLYFVRVWEPIENRPLALTKLMLLK